MSDLTNTFEQFSPDDIVAAVMIIDQACNAGAFTGWDNIHKAFHVRTRLLTFADQWCKAIAPEATDSNESTNPTEAQ